MKMHQLSIVVVCAGALCGAAFAQESQASSPRISGTQPFHATFSATTVNKDDFGFSTTPLFNGTSGAIRASVTITGDSTHGRYSGQALFEAIYTSPFTSCTQPGGGSGIQSVYKGFVVVMTFHATQDQLFLALSSGTDCFNPSVGISTGQATFQVIGGTGRFEGATGTFTNPYKGIGLAASALGPNGFFNAVAGTFDGSITLK
ncbi:MAG: hypothetical protein C5B51_16375 [Terriglobia bacterium]|nr:MAG: hypothetical protein C5B51_16375 [Terriglobia bacterium]